MLLKVLYLKQSTLKAVMEIEEVWVMTEKKWKMNTGWCNYCDISRHKEQAYWQLNGRPEESEKGGGLNRSRKLKLSIPFVLEHPQLADSEKNLNF